MPNPGLYVLAVSGGVDSMVLLYLLCKQPAIKLIVAHFNHGIRADSVKDEEFVQQVAQKLGLKFEAGYGKLGPSASEEKARDARYEFLNTTKDKYRADGIIAAHHQDDLIETALLNTLRGTKHRGLAAMELNRDLLRPLLGVPKSKILAYAAKNDIKWREDPSNKSLEYARNYLREKVVSKLTVDQRAELLKNADKVAEITPELDNIIATLSHTIAKGNSISRKGFITLPSDITAELMAYWLRTQTVQYDKKLIERLSLAIKTGAPGTRHDVNSALVLAVNKEAASFEIRQ